MPCRLGYGWTERGNTVPYPPLQGRVGHGRSKHNRGFLDLRGKPEIAAEVAEAAGSPGLRALLTDLAMPGSALFSLGCDLGTFRKRSADNGPRHATGGYVQLLATDYNRWEMDDYKALAKRLAPPIEASAGSDNWDVRFLLQTVRFNLDGFNDELVSLVATFNAWGADAAAASASRERLVSVLSDGFKQAGPA